MQELALRPLNSEDASEDADWTELHGRVGLPSCEGGDWSTYRHLSSIANWKLLMGPSCNMLEQLLRQYGIPFEQCLCGRELNGVATHLLGPTHFKTMYGMMPDGVAVESIREQFAVYLDLPQGQGCLEFNHMDGQIRISATPGLRHNVRPSGPITFCHPTGQSMRPPSAPPPLPMRQLCAKPVPVRTASFPNPIFDKVTGATWDDDLSLYVDLECNQYLETVLDLVNKKQEPAQQMILSFLRAKVLQCLPVEQHAPPILRLFGSRGYDAALPDSDLDVVCEIPYHTRANNDAILQRLYDVFRADARCTSVTNQIKYKHTVRFRMLDLPMDLTICRQVDSHRPSQMTEKVKEYLDWMPQCVRNLARLVTSIAKHSGCCSKGRGVIGEKLKSVHFVVLVIAWSQQEMWQVGRDAFALKSPALLLSEFLCWMCNFEFHQYSIDGFSETPFTFRLDAKAEEPLWISDPLDSSSNLGERIDPASFQDLIQKLQAAAHLLKERPREFWREAQDRWGYLRERQYSALLQRAPTAEKFLSPLCGDWFHSGQQIRVARDGEWYVASWVRESTPRISYICIVDDEIVMKPIVILVDGEHRRWKLDGKKSKPKVRVVWMPMDHSVNEETWVSAGYEEIVEV